eukprot:TRINITY_DN1306_c0_g1_i7.p1 TRINITY_DN1306_c0_g1~~TRINITY_DN1306_c0_g1_i7.p1  ORF type:complete len:2919 (-),score=679.49 TRINITY_DN1306_c0_g1_i7:1730-9988(-)
MPENNESSKPSLKLVAANEGKLIFTLVGAKDLENSDYIGKSDPYAVVQYKDEIFKSKTISNDLNPVWNLPLELTVTEEDPGEIHIQVFDEDYNGDDELGKTSIKIKDLIASKTIDCKSIKLEDCKSGEIQFSSSYSTIINEELLEKREDVLNIDVNKTEVTLPKKTNQKTETISVTLPKETTKRDSTVKPGKASSGTVHLTLVGAKDLDNADYMGKSDPYVVVRYKDKTFKSETVSNNLNPVWNFSITLEIIESDSGFIYIQVYDEDYNGDDEIGKTAIKVQDLINSRNIDGNWVKLEDCKNGQVQFSSNYSPIIIEDTFCDSTVEVCQEPNKLKPVDRVEKDNDEKSELLLRMSDLGIENIEVESEDKKIPVQAGEELSSVTGKFEFDLKSTQTKYDITKTQERQPRSRDYSQNFDKIVKKSCKKIIRRMDSDGNIIEEVVEEGKHPENWETSTVNMSSGIEVVTGHSKKTSIKKTIDELGNVISEDVQTSYDKDSDVDFEELYKTGFTAIPIKKTSVTTTKRIIKRIDEEGNVIEETFEGDDNDIIPDFDTRSTPVSIRRTSTQTSRKIIKRIDEDGNVTEEIITESDGNPTITSDELRSQFFSPPNVHFENLDVTSFPQTRTSRTSLSSRRVIKTVDSEGNVTEKIITEGDPDFSLDENEFRNQFKTSLTQSTRTSVTSSGIVRITDSDGNVTESAMTGDHDDNFGFNDEELRKHLSSMQAVTTKTSTASRNIVRTVDSEGNVTETIINEGDTDVPTIDNIHSTIMSSVPVAVKTTSLQTSRKIIRTTDASGNIIEEVIDEPITEATKLDKIPAEKDLDIMPENNESSKPSLKLVAANEGKLIFTLVGAKDLENSDYIGKSDPYAVVQYKDEIFKSKTISNDLNPVWNLPLELTVTEEDPGEIHIQVFDEDYNGDDELGKTSIKIKDLIASKTIDCKSIKLEDCKSGEIQFSSSYSTIINEELLEKREDVLNIDVNKTEVTLPKKTNQKTETISVTLPKETTKRDSTVKPGKASSGTVHLTLVGAKDLDNADYMGKSDPYVVVRYKDKTFKSETVSNNLNPVWNFSITLEIIESDSGFIYIQVYDEDYNGDDEIGKTAIKVQDLINSRNIDGNWVKLEDCKNGQVQFSSNYSPIIIEDTFCDSTVEVCQEPNKLKPVDRVEKDNDEKSELLLRMSDLGIENIEVESEDKKIPVQAGEELSSVTGKFEFDLKSTQTKYDITKTQERQPRSRDYSQNFDKIVKKSCKKIIRRMDSDGNIIEEVVEEGKHPENWETSTVNMSSGIEVVTGHSKKTSIKKTIDELGNVISEDVQTSYDKDSDVDFEELYKTGFTAIPIKKTSVTTTKRIIKRIDEEGNVIEETFEGDDNDIIPDFDTRSTPVSIRRTSTQTSRKIIKRIDEDGNVTEEIITESDGNPTITSDELRSQFFSPPNVHFENLDVTSFPQTRTSRTSLSSRRVIKTVDSEGNVTEKIITEGDPDFSLDENEFRNQFMTSLPQSTRTSVTSKRMVKMIDSDGNVTERVMAEGDDDNIFDNDDLRKHFSSMQPITTKTSMTSRKVIKTVDSEGNVTEEIINEGDMDDSGDDEFQTTILSSIPVAVKRTSFKTTRKIIRKTDESGNVTEEIIDEPVTESSNWQQIPIEKDFDVMCTTVKRTINTSGKVVDEQISVSQPDDISQDFDSVRNIDLESSLPTAVKRTSIKTTKSIIKRYDDQGNVIEETIDDSNPIIEREVWKRASVEIPSTMQVTSSNTSMTTIKRTVDEHGNVVNEEISTVESTDPSSQLETSSEKLKLISMGIDFKEVQETQENGKLIFTLHSAKNLENKDWVGKSDPYALVTLGQTVCKTQTVTNNLNPEFEQEMVFQINNASPSSLNIELFDEDITRDDCLGNTSIDVLPSKKHGKLVRQSKFLSNSKTGEIIYSIEFIPEVKDTFCDSTVESCLKEPRRLKPVDRVEKDNEDKSGLLLRMSDLGIENVELVSEDKNEDVLLKDVIDLQASTKKKISGLMKTIQQVELDQADASPQVYSRKVIRKIDSEGNVVEEVIEGEDSDPLESHHGIENQTISSRKISQTTVKQTVKILDGEGNVIEEREVDTTADGSNFDFGMLRNISAQRQVTKLHMDQQGNILNESIENINVDDPEEYAQSIQRSFVTSPESSTSSYVIRKEFSSESDKSPTFEDIVYSEYPHLTKPMDQSCDILSSNVATSSHSVQYFHSSSEPFQNITSLRAHFVQAFDEDVPDAKSTESDPAVKDVKFDDSVSNYFGNSNININRSVSSSTQLFSSTHSFSGSEFSSNKSATMESSGINNPNLYMLASEEPSLEELVSESSVTSWMEPILSGNCLVEKEFWKSSDDLPANSNVGTEASQTHAFFSSSSHSISPDQCLSGSHSLRSPVSMLKANSPVLFQSLPSSPKKKNSVKTVITSELFSSDKDISRSLELVYTEPNEDPKEKLSNTYKSVAPTNRSLVNRKPSFTQLKRPSIDTQFDIMSGSPSPEWKVTAGKSVEFTPCDFNNDYSFQTKSSSITQSIQISPTSPQECQISKDICSKDPPCCQLFEPQSQSSVRSPERKFQYVQGLEEQYSANVEERIETFQKEGTTSPSQPRSASSSFDDEDSEPESPRSPSPKVSPGSKSPSPRVSQHNSHPDLPRQSSSAYGESSGASSNGSSRNDLDNIPNNDVAPLMKETDQELLDEMIVKDVPESESSTDPVKKFEEAHPTASIDSIQEDQEDASDSECHTINVPSAASTTLTTRLKGH